jgi:hypothetical protein
METVYVAICKYNVHLLFFTKNLLVSRYPDLVSLDRHCSVLTHASAAVTDQLHFLKH